jgi:small GTP-binding protein
MLKAVLNKEEADLLEKERLWLADLEKVLARAGAPAGDLSAFSRSVRQLEELFLLVVVGEFNSGKSQFINALLGRPLLEVGVTPTTNQISILMHGEESRRRAEDVELQVLDVPIDLLRHINIVDTPGTNAVMQRHQILTEEFVPRSDLVLFVTCADRPFTESERVFLNRIREWGKKVVVVINKIDIFERPEELDRVVEFVRQNAASALGAPPEIFPVSARQALLAGSGDPDLREKSGLDPVEGYIRDSLDERGRLRLKFLNPLGVGDRLIEACASITGDRLALLADDVETLSGLEGQLAQYKLDMERDFRFRLADIENILHEMERRGNAFFDETMRLANVMDLVNKKRIRENFERRVVAGAPQEVEKKAAELIDWMVGAELDQWQSVTDYVQKRLQHYRDRIVGDAGGKFRYDRERLIESVGRAARQVVESYDKEGEARRIGESAFLAVAGAAAGVGAGVGLGALVTAMATTAAADVTGIIAAGLLTALGLLVIPARRRAAKREIGERMSELRSSLTGSLASRFDEELRRALRRIDDTIGPYARFVRAERSKLEGIREELAGCRRRQAALRSEIEALF